MKSIKDLEAIRQRTLDDINLRNDHRSIRVVVGMGTCGISAGARPVMMEFVEEIKRRGVQDAMVTQTGCIGLCQYEPIVEVFEPGKEKVTYVKMDPEKAVEVVDKHLCKGFVVSKYTLSSTNL